jgi:hypothetical protein
MFFGNLIYLEPLNFCVKKLAAICLLALLLFNVAGYRVLFSLLEQKATTRLENKIDAGNYSESQLVEIKIPLSMPYYSDKDYESVYGETIGTVNIIDM